MSEDLREKQDNDFNPYKFTGFVLGLMAFVVITVTGSIVVILKIANKEPERPIVISSEYKMNMKNSDLVTAEEIFWETGRQKELWAPRIIHYVCEDISKNPMRGKASHGPIPGLRDEDKTRIQGYFRLMGFGTETTESDSGWVLIVTWNPRS